MVGNKRMNHGKARAVHTPWYEKGPAYREKVQDNRIAAFLGAVIAEKQQSARDFWDSKEALKKEKRKQKRKERKERREARKEHRRLHPPKKIPIPERTPEQREIHFRKKMEWERRQRSGSWTEPRFPVVIEDKETPPWD